MRRRRVRVRVRRVRRHRRRKARRVRGCGFVCDIRDVSVEAPAALRRRRALALAPAPVPADVVVVAAAVALLRCLTVRPIRRRLWRWALFACLLRPCLAVWLHRLYEKLRQYYCSVSWVMID